jgi:hypothetical protein
MWNQKISRIAPDKVLSFPLPGFLAGTLALGQRPFGSFGPLRKRASLQQNSSAIIFSLERVAKSCCFTEIIGDTFTA